MPFFKKTRLISGLEFPDIVAILEDIDPILSALAVSIYMGSSEFLSAVTRGEPSAAVIAVLVARFWELIGRYNSCAWFPRFPSKMNPPVHPTIGKRLPYNGRHPIGSKSLASL